MAAGIVVVLLSLMLTLNRYVDMSKELPQHINICLKSVAKSGD